MSMVAPKGKRSKWDTTRAKGVINFHVNTLLQVFEFAIGKNVYRPRSHHFG